MAITARLGCASAFPFSEPKSQLAYDKDEQEKSHITFHSHLGRAFAGCYEVGFGIRQRTGCGVGSFSTGGHPFGAFLKPCLITHETHDALQIKVHVAADYPDAKPDASSNLRSLGYHPLEEISNFEIKKSMELADRRLTDVEIARTLAEVNSNAFIFALDQDGVIGTEVQFLVDEHGDFYFQVDDDNEFLPMLISEDTYKHAVIGYGDIEDLVIEQEELHGEIIMEGSDEDISDDKDDLSFEVWDTVSPEAVDLVLDELEEEISESAGDWAGFETLQSVHPIHFAEQLVEASSSDHLKKIENPSKNLKITGEVRHLADEEKAYVQQIWYDRFHWDVEDNEDSESIEESQGHEYVAGFEVIVDVISFNSTSGNENPSDIQYVEGRDPKDCSSKENQKDVLMKSSAYKSSAIKNEEDVEVPDHLEAGASLYKLEINTINLSTGNGSQFLVDLSEFCQAKPDVVAHSAPTIIQRVNDGGQEVKHALKALCSQRKGLLAEEVSLIELDSYGVDLRVHSGREVQTVRISFNQRATSIENAEQLVNQLLYPRHRSKVRRHRRSQHQNNPR
eukprot:c27657_g1_i3 orf=99-1790(+)